MPRCYRHIKEYEKIFELKEKSYTNGKNFLSILKTECFHRVKLKTFEEARFLIG